MSLKVKLPATVYLGSAVDPGSGGGGGGSSSFPTIVTDSGSSLPSASGYSVGDKFLNTSTKKIYTPVANGYIANTNATITATTIDWDSGTDIIANTEYADKTNGKLYLYDGTTLLEITTTFVKIKGNATDNSSLSTALNNKQNKAIKFTNKSASNWVADNTYPDYGYKCEITNLNGVTSDSFAQVIFAQAEADSGNYATVCLTDFQKITIYSKVNDTITIPSIVVMGA